MDKFDWIFISIVLYLFVAIAAACFAFYGRRASVFEPIGQYLIFLTLFTLPLPIRTLFTLEIDGNVTPYLPEIVGWLPISVLFAAMSIPLFSFAYYSSFARRFGCLLPRFNAIPERLDSSRSAFVLISFLSLFLIYKLTQSSGGILPFLLLGYGSTAETFGRGHLAVGFPWLFVATLFLLYRYAQYRRKADAVMFVIALTGIISIQLVTGNRGMLLYIVITVLCFIDQCVARFRIRSLIVIGIAGFLALNLLGLTRQSNYDNLSGFIEQSLTGTEAVTLGGPGGLFYTLSIGEFVVPFETLPQMIRTTGITEDPWLGRSFVAAPAYLIPGVIFPDRPQSLTRWYMRQFYGGESKLNEGRAFFFLSEAYMNFGPVGVVLIALLWGWLWGGLRQWVLYSRREPAVVLIYALLTAYMFRCIAGDFSTLIAGTTQQSLSIVIVGLWITRFRKHLNVQFGMRGQPRVSE